MNSKKTLLILAGGLGSRYKGLKQVDGILDNGSPILEYSVYDALAADFSKVVIIVNRLIPQSYIERLNAVSEAKGFELHWVYQEMDSISISDFDYSERQKPWGTGHAVLCAKDVIQEPFVMINADDFYGKEVYQLTAEGFAPYISETKFGLAAYPVDTTLSGNGTVARGICTLDSENYLVHVEEQTSIQKINDTIIYTENGGNIEIAPDTLVSMNFFIFHPSIFNSLEKYFYDFIASKPGSTQEFYIPSAVQRMIDEKKVKVMVKASPSQWMGVTYADDKNNIKDFLMSEIQKNRYPEDLWK
ncbi:sugar phosphate nucleotidyltransferase [Chryseobacterium sp. BIGb0232]|uniref:sugar phosphate nucleotidyltransferase n=1 Tax=Chryseobacterium sp. BIGb0232 TaxID=2940598 RepID=UPI000F4673FD|nr:sugar phosphate nucleotidyltransferase [Chryseobacterium sp. BIGb0232]MCS4301141.1 dTDP-glucose pyrophosphorylase [Chryseobacterium sp. BIGb0232]ROS19998.1 UTP-glucose-1-phosphate uridylyltransferase [Chryseobacterium nakagawai]